MKKEDFPMSFPARWKHVGLLLCSLLAAIGPRSAYARLVPRGIGAVRQEKQEETNRSETIQYTLHPVVVNSHRLLDVVMRFPVPNGADHVTIQMPVWSPGDYHLQNHAEYVRNLSAWGDVGAAVQGQELAVKHADRNSWDVAVRGSKEVDVHYTLPETPPGLFSDNIRMRDNQIFWNGPAVFLYVVGRKQKPVSLVIQLPNGWQAQTALEKLPLRLPAGPDAAEYHAPDYDTLVDSPVVLAAPGVISSRDFLVSGVPHRLVFFGKPIAKGVVDSYVSMLKRIVQSEMEIMRSLPYARYLFLFDVDGAPGGLEHLDCCRIGLPSRAALDQVAPHIAHELFHAWNVKRIRPLALGPFDYVHPPRTRNLWFAEGVTDYYAYVAVRRAGLTTPEQFLDHWNEAIHALQGNPNRLQVSADEASLRVWEDGYSSGFGGLSYYEKGALIGLCLDLSIRGVTENRRSLDDVMRLLMRRHAPPLPGYAEDELEAVINEVAGQDLSALYDRLARSTHELPLRECLGYAGLSTSARILPDGGPAQAALREDWLGPVNQNGEVP